MSDQPLPDDRPPAPGDRPQLSAVVDGDEVREIVARSERQIELLLGELAVARREADDAERRVSEHRSAPWLDALPYALAITPDAPLTGSPSDPAPVPMTTPVASSGPTVVDRRPSLAEQREAPRSATSAASAASAASGTSAGPSHRRRSRPRRQLWRRARLALGSILTTGWLWKVGLVLVIGALVLLKVG
ncbi:MAG: hypothetical protein WBG41_16080 [Acidimicrobiales bacterium]